MVFDRKCWLLWPCKRDNLLNLVCHFLWRMEIYRKRILQQNVLSRRNVNWNSGQFISFLNSISPDKEEQPNDYTRSFHCCLMKHSRTCHDAAVSYCISWSILTWKFLANVRKSSYDALTFSSIHVFVERLMYRILNTVVCCETYHSAFRILAHLHDLSLALSICLAL